MYNDKYFVVDMTSCSTTGEIINSISLALETLDNSGQNIILKLSNNNLKSVSIIINSIFNHKLWLYFRYC